ncbi:MAG TPA: choice-of-anchor Q domain-containing protein [Gemmatimonadales bacterium]|nr:choice-of-anchor Q domain-containing protein [Gemmatimonadales bacterium]
MRISRRLFLLLPALYLAACGRDELPTAPDSPAGPGVSSAAAATLVVNSLADPGNGVCNATECTLREAIKDSRSSAITFAAGLAGSSIILARPGAGGGTLVIDKTLRINGPSGHVTITRRTTDPEFRILTIGTGGTASLTNLTLQNGKTDRNGGGIINFGRLTLRDCLVAENAGLTGGGIDNHGPLTLTRTSIVFNSGLAGPTRSAAGGIHNHLDRVTITNSSVTGNSGIGIFNGGGRLDIANSFISSNSSTGLSQDWGTATLEHVAIARNHAGGIVNHQGSVLLNHSVVASNSAEDGGGILNVAGGDINILNSTINQNAATGRGGGIHNTSGDPFGRLSARVTVANSTVYGNSAELGGGIENSNDLGGAEVRILNSTIDRNSARTNGGGVRNEDSEEDSDQSNSVFLINTIVARNTAPSAPDVADGAGRFNLIGNGTGSGISSSNGNQVGTSSSLINPRIGPLVNNGGPTRTQALLAGSPAIDAASTPDCPPTDQRGVARPQGSHCDIGSYEK